MRLVPICYSGDTTEQCQTVVTVSETHNDEWTEAVLWGDMSHSADCFLNALTLSLSAVFPSTSNLVMGCRSKGVSVCVCVCVSVCVCV